MYVGPAAEPFATAHEPASSPPGETQPCAEPLIHFHLLSALAQS